MVDTGEKVRIAAGIFYITVLAAFLLPIGIHAVTDVTHTNNATFTQKEDVRITIEGDLDSNATMVEVPELLGLVGDNRATIKLINNETGESTKKTIDEGESADMQLSGKTIHVTVIDTIDTDTVKVGYEYPEKFEWDNDTITLWDILDLSIVVALLAVLTAMLVWVRY